MKLRRLLRTKDGKVYHEGDEISLDGSTGKVYDGLVPMKEPEISGNFETFMNWADERRVV
jgi:pyruvate,orthophosphate dikinase